MEKSSLLIQFPEQKLTLLIQDSLKLVLMGKMNYEAKIELVQREELSGAEQDLLAASQEILKDAYAPYSKYKVGAAVQLKSGIILKSSNQENVSFPVGICAEQSLLAFAGANYPKDAPSMLAISAQREGEEVFAKVSPCGMCRQAILEFENRFEHPIQLLIQYPDGQVVRIDGIQNLLPLSLGDLSL